LIVRRERPHPGAQFTIFDEHGYRYTCFLTDQTDSDIAVLELRHRGRARVEDSIRAGKDTGMRNLPHHGFEHNQTWLELSLIAQDLLAWMKLICLDGELAKAEPKRLSNDCCTPPPNSCVTDGAPSSSSTATGPGPTRSPPRSRACGRSQRSAERTPHAGPRPSLPTRSADHVHLPENDPARKPKTADSTTGRRAPPEEPRHPHHSHPRYRTAVTIATKTANRG